MVIHMHRHPANEYRISLGLDPETRALVERPYEDPVQIDMSLLEGISQRDRDVITRESKPNRIKQRREEAVLQIEGIRAEILNSPFVEEGQILDKLSKGRTAVGAAGKFMAYGWLQGARSLSFQDHNTRIYPLYQFEETETFKPFDVIAAVNLVQGKQPQETTGLSDVYWWHLSAQNREIDAKVDHAATPPMQLLASPNLHHIIVQRAVFQRLNR